MTNTLSTKVVEEGVALVLDDSGTPEVLIRRGGQAGSTVEVFALRKMGYADVKDMMVDLTRGVAIPPGVVRNPLADLEMLPNTVKIEGSTYEVGRSKEGAYLTVVQGEEGGVLIGTYEIVGDGKEAYAIGKAGDRHKIEWSKANG